MTDSIKGRPPRGSFSEGEQQTGLYEQMGGVVEYVITRIFGIGEKDAQSLALEVLLAYEVIKPRPPDVNAWLIAGACANAKRHLERRGLTTGDEAEKTRAAERWLREKEALDLLPERCRTVLRLRYDEGKTFEEIAAELGVTLRSAKRMVLDAGEKLRALTRPKEA
jgi:RNA polymerase sigma factor (sigma-70 family)